MNNEFLTVKDEFLLHVSNAMRDGVEPTVNMLIEVFGPDGVLKDARRVHNTVTTAGKAGIADQILGAPSLNKPTHCAVGTGSPGANALGTEIARVIHDSKIRSTNQVIMSTTFITGVGTGALTEAGIFDASSTGNAWMTASFGVVTKAAGDQVVITWTLTFP